MSETLVRQGKSQLLIHPLIVRDYLVETLLAVIDKIHLVHGDDDISYTQQTHQKRVAPRLGQHPFPGIYQDNGKIGRARTGDHISRILLVPRGIGDYIFAPVGSEKAVCHIYRDTLLSFTL